MFQRFHSDIEALPVELISHIASFLPSGDRVAFGGANQRLRDIVLERAWQVAQRRSFYAVGYAPGEVPVDLVVGRRLVDMCIRATASSSYALSPSQIPLRTPCAHVYANEGVVLRVVDASEGSDGKATVIITRLACPLRGVTHEEFSWAVTPPEILTDDGRAAHSSLSFIVVEPSYDLAIAISLQESAQPVQTPIIVVRPFSLASGRSLPHFANFPGGAVLSGYGMSREYIGLRTLSTNGRWLALSVADTRRYPADVSDNTLLVMDMTSTTLILLDGNWCHQFSFLDEEHAAIVVSDDHVNHRLEIVDIKSLANVHFGNGRFQGHVVLVILQLPFTLRWAPWEEAESRHYGVPTIIGHDSGVRRPSQGFHNRGAHIVPDATAYMRIELPVVEDPVPEGQNVNGFLSDTLWLNLHVSFLLLDRHIRSSRVKKPGIAPIAIQWRDWACSTGQVVVQAGWRALPGARGSRSTAGLIGHSFLWSERNPRKAQAVVAARGTGHVWAPTPHAWIERLSLTIPPGFASVTAHLQDAGLNLDTSPVTLSCPRQPDLLGNAYQEWLLCGDTVLALTLERNADMPWLRPRIERIDAYALTSVTQ